MKRGNNGKFAPTVLLRLDSVFCTGDAGRNWRSISLRGSEAPGFAFGSPASRRCAAGPARRTRFSISNFREYCTLLYYFLRILFLIPYFYFFDTVFLLFLILRRSVFSVPTARPGIPTSKKKTESDLSKTAGASMPMFPLLTYSIKHRRTS